jgi:uncharacterized protein YjbI with pentapeptide repeats
MRASAFQRCKFVGAVLCAADLRRSSFEQCDFTGADLTGAVAGDERSKNCLLDCLSPEQQEVVVLVDEGPEPPGG